MQHFQIVIQNRVDQERLGHTVVKKKKHLKNRSGFKTIKVCLLLTGSLIYVQEVLLEAVPCLVHHSCCFAGVEDEWHPSLNHHAIQSLEFLPVPTDM